MPHNTLHTLHHTPHTTHYSKVQMVESEPGDSLVSSSVSRTNIPFSSNTDEDDTLDDDDLVGERRRTGI